LDPVFRKVTLENERIKALVRDLKFHQDPVGKILSSSNRTFGMTWFVSASVNGNNQANSNWRRRYVFRNTFICFFYNLLVKCLNTMTRMILLGCEWFVEINHEVQKTSQNVSGKYIVSTGTQLQKIYVVYRTTFCSWILDCTGKMYC